MPEDSYVKLIHLPVDLIYEVSKCIIVLVT